MDATAYTSSDNSAAEDERQDDSDTTFKFNNQAHVLLKCVEKLYRENLFTDIILKTNAETGSDHNDKDNHDDEKHRGVFHCHKSVLSTCPYFFTMFASQFKESVVSEIPISIDKETLKSVLDFIYTGVVQLDVDNVENLLSAANFLQLNVLREGCAKFMEKHVTENNCLETYFYAKCHQSTSLAKHSLDMVCKNFVQLVKRGDNCKFLQLKFDELEDIISRDELFADEKCIFEACLNWLNYDTDRYIQYGVDVMKRIRFANMDIYYFCDNVASNENLIDYADMRTIIEQVKYYNLVIERWHETDLNFIPRMTANYERGILLVANPYHHHYPDRDGVGDGIDWLNVKTGEIIQVATLPKPLFLPGVCVNGRKSICIAGGGVNRGKRYAKGEQCISNRIYVMCNKKSINGQLELKKLEDNLQIERAMFSLVPMDGRVYAIGGQTNSGLTSSVESFTLENDNKLRRFLNRSLPKPLRGCTSISYRGCLYVFGGEDDDQVLNNIYKYEPVRDTWKQVGHLKQARSLASCVIFRNQIWIVGGSATTTNKCKKDVMAFDCHKSVEIFEPKNCQIFTGPDLPFDLCGHGLVKYDETLWIIGGEQANGLVACVYKLINKDATSGGGGGGNYVWAEQCELKLPVSTFGYCVVEFSKDYAFWQKDTKGINFRNKYKFRR